LPAETELCKGLYRERGNWALARLEWGGIPAYAGMTAQGRYRAEWIPAYAGMTAQGRYRAEWIPAYAGMTVMGAPFALPLILGAIDGARCYEMLRTARGAGSE